jgi:hypothetical protein
MGRAHSRGKEKEESKQTDRMVNKQTNRGGSLFSLLRDLILTMNSEVNVGRGERLRKRREREETITDFFSVLYKPSRLLFSFILFLSSPLSSL